MKSVKFRLSCLSVETGIELLDVAFASILVLAIILFFLNVILLPKNVIFTRNPTLNLFSVYYALQRLSLNDELLAFFSAITAAPTPLMLFNALRIRQFKDSTNFGDAWNKTINCLKLKSNGRKEKATKTLIVLATLLMVSPFATILILQPVIIDYFASNLTPQWYQANMTMFLSSLILAYTASKISKTNNKK